MLSNRQDNRRSFGQYVIKFKLSMIIQFFIKARDVFNVEDIADVSWVTR